MSQSSPWKHCLESAALSDLGLRRANNQDSYTVFLAGNQRDFMQRGHLFMVADGMGAHAAGELASKIATDVVPLTYHKLGEKSPPDALLAAVLDANGQILARGEASPEFKGMGTTTTALVLLPQGVLLAHVGDSRAYRVRGQTIEQLTFDHSLVWELQATGQKIEEQFSNLIGKNIITRSLGPNQTVRVDLEGMYPYEVGDTFLLCSDGLSGQVQDAEIGAVLLSLPLSEAVRALVDLANLRGGPDNITVVALRVLGPQIAESTSGQTADAAVGIKSPSINPLVAIIFFLAAMAAFGLWVIGQKIAALVSLLAAVVSGITAWVQSYSSSGKILSFEGQRYGRGPYMSCGCTPNEEFIDKLIEIIKQLRTAAEGANWKIDWNRFNQLIANAQSAGMTTDHVGSAREYLRAISFMMAELKKQPPVGDG
ncbi:MAG TPA: PP2C family serine/threonine-protein phosphatase [Thermoguttaceae bacterium]